MAGKGAGSNQFVEGCIRPNVKRSMGHGLGCHDPAVQLIPGFELKRFSRDHDTRDPFSADFFNWGFAFMDPERSVFQTSLPVALLSATTY